MTANSSAAYDQEYKRLNAEQKAAVDTIDGPLLVLAGPGTGKTQLLSARVANILLTTDAAPGNILCLTFTDSAASVLRARLFQFIGSAAYDVTISTYHSFGSDIIKTYHEYFTHIGTDHEGDIRLERPVDEITQINLLSTLVAKLSFDNPLAPALYYLKDLLSTISDLKTNLINPQGLQTLAKDNLQQIDAAQVVLDEVINKTGSIPRQKDAVFALYTAILAGLSKLKGELLALASASLKEALKQGLDNNSTKPLTVWKNEYLYKNHANKFSLTRRATSAKMLNLAALYADYEKSLSTAGLYDFNDMILRAISGIRDNSELGYNLQERYQYILLDEFQDTNPAQFELVKLLASHPVNEGRPNVMAVGDDDQSIYAFQGATLGNIQDFLNSFKDVAVINLVRNYRSHPDILHFAGNISSQINDRLHRSLSGIDKILVASSTSLPATATLVRREFTTQVAEYNWIAQQIKTLLDAGTSPNQVAVISPKHLYLENLVPFLSAHTIPLTYEKRENILKSEIVSILHTSAQLLQALSRSEVAGVNELFPRVLSLPYWGLPIQDIWEINFAFADRDNTQSWPQLAQHNPTLTSAINFYLSLAGVVELTPLEIILDQLLGTTAVKIGDQDYYSPLKHYYFNPQNRTTSPLTYYQTLAHLSTIRQNLRQYQKSQDNPLTLTDFLEFFAMYEKAGAVLTSSQTLSQGNNSVSLMTAYKAKGLEFDHVFILHAHDDVWGSTSRGRGNNIALPLNLCHIRYNDLGDDERLRLLFVALTRARISLFLTSHTHSPSGKPTPSLKYLGEGEGISPHLPAHAQTITHVESDPTTLAPAFASLWSSGSRLSLPLDFRDLLKPRLESYLMSPTHLNTFLDLERGGPEIFLTHTLLRFPSAPTPSSEYGVAIHDTLEWYQSEGARRRPPSLKQTLEHFDSEINRRYLSTQDRADLRAKGRLTLKNYLSSRPTMFSTPARAEVNFNTEGVVIGAARLTGKIDRIEVDQQAKTLSIVDFKTGRSLSRWDNSLKAYKYRHQLYFYKLLLENSHTWRTYQVTGARLEFVEPLDYDTQTVPPPLTIAFDDNEEEKLKRLLTVVWDKIQSLDLPSTDKYPRSIQGTHAFEKDLLAP